MEPKHMDHDQLDRALVTAVEELHSIEREAARLERLEEVTASEMLGAENVRRKLRTTRALVAEIKDHQDGGCA
jgi:hypothetical protein